VDIVCETKSFLKLSEAKKGVTIPLYQRAYKWEKTHVQNLIDDFFNYIDTKHENYIKNKTYSDYKNNIPIRDIEKYFAGSIVSVFSEKGENPRELIDGQQRYTTMFLANFIKFALARLWFRESALTLPRDAIDSLTQSWEILTGSNNSLEVLRIDLENATPEEDKTKTIKEIINYIGLPEEKEDDPEYNTKYQEELQNWFENNKLKLSYDRKSFDTEICTALSGCIFKFNSGSVAPKLQFLDKEKSNYRDAIEIIFNRLVGHLPKDQSSLSLKHMIHLIDLFLERVEFVSIQTTQQNDAYTLFEVLNDRSLALSDLDLIKNKFYKHYCEGPSLEEEKDEEEQNNLITELEDIWANMEKKLVSNRGLIAYFAIQYITKSETLSDKTEKMRDDVEKYLSEIDGNKYGQEEIKKDFRAIQLATILIEELRFRYKGSAWDKVIEKNRVEDRNQTYRTLHLLQALNQKGVMVGITALILHEAFQRQPADQENFIKACLLNKTESYTLDAEAKTAIGKIEKIATKLWQLTMRQDDYEAGRIAAKKLIGYWKKAAECPDSQLVEMSGDYKWLKDFHYESKTTATDIKLRILFDLLLHHDFDFDEGCLQAKQWNRKKASEGWDFDHLEPKSDATKKEYDGFYFNLGKENSADYDENLNLIHGLGNMFPLEKKENRQKSAKPLAWIISKNLTDLGLEEHWLTVQVKNMLEQDSTDNKVPTQQFFKTREERLRKIMMGLINNFGENKIKIDFN
jgi:uncharacterized protein with ParB-like and HNH nuclease domain